MFHYFSVNIMKRRLVSKNSLDRFLAIFSKNSKFYFTDKMMKVNVIWIIEDLLKVALK